MASFTNLDTIQRPSTGAVAPASWGDAVNDNCNFLDQRLQWFLGSAQYWDAGVFMQADTVTFTAASGGTTISFGKNFTTTNVVVLGDLVTSGGATSLTIGAVNASGFTVKVWDGSTQVTSGSWNVRYIALGI